MEVGEEYVKYKKWSNTEGPNFTLKITEILSINYENGDKDDFSTITNTPQTSTINNNVSVSPSTAIATTNNRTYSKEELDKAINEAANKAAVSSRAGRGAIIAGGIITFIGLSNVIGGITSIVCIGGESGHTIGGVMIGVGAVATGLGWGLISGGKNKKELYTTQLIKHEFELGNYALTPSVDMYTNEDAEFSGIGAGLCLTF